MVTPNNQYFPFIDGDENLRRLAETIRLTLAGYIRKHKLSALVLGISGGIDSSLCAALCKPVCEANGIPLIGRSITIETNKPTEIALSIAVGEAFCHDFAYLDITETYFHNKKLLVNQNDTILTKLRLGNMKARMRMILLYDLAQLHKGIVISTDNYTEFLTGFWTLHGDVGDYAPIMNLWKTEVYHLSSHLLSECNELQKSALQKSIDATPVDGLGISESDCEQLKVDNYFEADRIFQDYFTAKGTEYENHPLIQRFRNSTYKRTNPIAISREHLLTELQ
ncbi:NAD(+) synthase [Bacteroidales bacterium OttesenSCG-928-B11]|nr:NAD(+) synthase [Bacteroidales bacterium OttesenSCG-928-C03]MDL2312392.1 NAD(+) synthase [Bacteroidales bacterium OttesenSCG-928-B11]MDL2326970.1 NAD(+) synthase [Bacteroidales bacterium OttesenSCG-928-A14]